MRYRLLLIFTLVTPACNWDNPVEPIAPDDMPIVPDMPIEPDPLPPPEPEKPKDFDWKGAAVFTEVPAVGFSGADYGSAYYKDVMGHASRKITGYSVPTNAHETNHMLNNEQRNRTGETDQTVYFENGQAIMVLEPSMSAKRIREYVPSWVKGKSSRYKGYVVDQVDRYWDNVLYQFDEWAAYRTDAKVGVELDKAGTLDRGVGNEVCIMDGAVEFLYFAGAIILALETEEPDYLKSNLQFKAGFALLAEQTTEYFKYGQGRQVFDCSGSEIYEHFLGDEDTADIRKAIRNFMGEGWTKRVLGY